MTHSLVQIVLLRVNRRFSRFRSNVIDKPFMRGWGAMRRISLLRNQGDFGQRDEQLIRRLAASLSVARRSVAIPVQLPKSGAILSRTSATSASKPRYNSDHLLRLPLGPRNQSPVRSLAEIESIRGRRDGWDTTRDAYPDHHGLAVLPRAVECNSAGVVMSRDF